MIIIRKAIPEDSAAIIEFQQKMAAETEQIILEKEIITKGVKAVFTYPERGQYWVASSDNIIVASLLITYEWSDWRNSNVWWIQSVYVTPPYRRRGVFSSLFRHIRKEGERLGFAGLRLYVESNNSRAQRTYEALGMKSDHYTMYEWLMK